MKPVKHNRGLASTLAWTGCCCSLLFSICAWPQDNTALEMEKSGQRAFEARQYRQALELYSEGAVRADDPAVKARLDFRQAVTLQQMADQADAEDKTETLQQAARLYHAYLKQNPGSSATANNLAKIYETLGLSAMGAGNAERGRAYFSRADAYFQNALRANDASRGLYLRNYAEFLEKSGQWEHAKEIYASLVQAFPVSPALQQTLAVTYREHGMSDLAELLWNFLDAGYIQQATGFALDALGQSANVKDDHRIELLTIVCEALAQGTGDPDAFATTGTGHRITMLGADDYIGAGAAEIGKLFGGKALERRDYPWWTGRSSGRWDPDEGVYPTDGFRDLIRSLGSRAKRTGNFALAESYFRLAASLKQYEVDPVAIRDLVRMYAESDQFGKIDDVLKNYEVRLYADKARGYANSDVKKIFQYHQTLGELYALIERWGDSDKVDSAIFQLEHAQEASQILAEKPGVQLPEAYRFTPQMVDQLSMAYYKTGKIDKSLEVRIDQAEIYKKAGETRDAIRVLTPIEKLEVPSTLSGHYRALLDSYSRDGLLKSPPVVIDKSQLKNKVPLKDQ